jgi:hypothetical protein
MFKPVQFERAVEDRVRFVEETDPAQIVEATYAELKAGTSPLDLLTASTLAVVRSTEIPPQHHGGPLHPVCGVRAVCEVAERLSGSDAFLPIIQHVALCNNHVHSPQMGPYLMAEIEPMAGAAKDIGSFHIQDAVLTEGLSEEAQAATEGIEATKAAFHKSVRAMQAPAAEHYFLWLLDHLSHGEVVDQLLPIAIRRNGYDDHNFLYPVYTARALDCIGWQWAQYLFRPPVRCQARRAPRLLSNEYDFKNVEALVDDYGLMAMDIPTETHAGETDAIAALGAEIGRCARYLDTIELLARGLRDGLSLAGVGEALSVGAARAYLCTSYGNPMDSHLHTGTNNRRYLLNEPGIGKRNRILGLLTAFTGPEVLLAEPRIEWEDNLEGEATKGLANRSQGELLEAITASIESQPWLDWRKIGVDRTVAPDSVKETVALARQYAECGYAPEPYFDRLAEIACRDDFTEMHSLKHFQAIVDEYYTTREPLRWLHLVSAAKSAAVIHVGKEHSIYEQAKSLLAA